MNTFFNTLNQSVRSFANDEDGAQVIEYALIIAVVSIALVLALQGLTKGGYFATFITRVANCLTTATCT
ncbi:pilus assembly protein Flp/PilA [Collimonas sp. OK242]|jgi:pilus assembly protein Flp/PilA|uniref:Flp family type IVb pilin n=1 Tax=Collimonas sp. OK242 TaxID=1798195 RepID=UPI0008981F9A|nr:Flp family type IVb pilin [Collimonas sp. OK242]SDY55017.1 pilus assembly protein Flp/PilA [Collimonas sp. OK242]